MGRLTLLVSNVGGFTFTLDVNYPLLMIGEKITELEASERLRYGEVCL